MNWIVSSIIMFFSSVALYLFVRKSSKHKLPVQFNNLAMFMVPFFVYLGIGLATHQNYSISFQQLLMIAGIAIFFSYVGNLSSLVSMEQAPNPGYSLIISKSYVLFTSLVAVVLFDAQLTIPKVVGILMIVLFSGILVISSPATREVASKKWIPLAFVAFFCWGMLSLASKYMFVQGINMYVYLTYLYAMVSVCILIDSVRKKIEVKQFLSYWKVFVSIGLLGVAFSAFQFIALDAAPNIGYVNAINAASISAVTIGASIFFKDDFSVRKFIGVIGVTIGLFIILVG